ncbi:5-(carboxyamino)imidazole ribonucleotide synthase [Sphingomonas jatrophae]|uniref:N5-carboxyaminoimidazole ribonucleotide synthase n=1 Tax=Sphingomonas jatrophae TaxID=1166337 RepID=A0A1I6M948_9SPHN|nr:5-(carboxyamino)imidazole ribonucleotide synthase [Sphingomonas jatrophae]SFS12143.1 5-(carboxyamino)imidazole ribonucleotide synthase [Sphingomonas jatrophae]
MIPPGSTIGILGGGQLGRMIAIAAAQLGYRTHIYAPEASGPAIDVARNWTRAAYEDEAALAAFAAQVDVVTYEFENVPVAPLKALGHTPLHPPAAALEVAQDRLAEKSFAERLGIATAPWAAVDDATSLAAALEQVGTPAILKTRRFGYDGKGQARIMAPEDAAAAWDAVGRRPAVLEGFVTFEAEFSIVAVRGADAFATYEAPENRHKDGILATSTLPASSIIRDQQDQAEAITRQLAEALDYCGVLTCEYFATADGPVFNEMAPRVHNSGHWTIEGAATSQFENHVRAICGLPLGWTARAFGRVEMHNLIGAEAGGWHGWLEQGGHLHLYGKGEARPGRKMGHVTLLG